jgi:hypothetical protein
VRAAVLRNPLQIRQQASLNGGIDDPRRRSVDNDEQDTHAQARAMWVPLLASPVCGSLIGDAVWNRRASACLVLGRGPWPRAGKLPCALHILPENSPMDPAARGCDSEHAESLHRDSGEKDMNSGAGMQRTRNDRANEGSRCATCGQPMLAAELRGERKQHTAPRPIPSLPIWRCDTCAVSWPRIVSL